MNGFETEEGYLISHAPINYSGLLTPLDQQDESLTGYFNDPPIPEKSDLSLISYPFSLITEVYQAGKTYAGKALETAKNIIAYPYENLTALLAKEKPTGVIKTEFDLKKFLAGLFKPPWIFVLLGFTGLYIYSVFKKR